MPPYTLLLYTPCGIVVNTFPLPSYRLDIIEGRHSRSIWETISPAIPNPIDIPFHVIDAVERSSQDLMIVIDDVKHD